MLHTSRNRSSRRSFARILAIYVIAHRSCDCILVLILGTAGHLESARAKPGSLGECVNSLLLRGIYL